MSSYHRLWQVGAGLALCLLGTAATAAPHAVTAQQLAQSNHAPRASLRATTATPHVQKDRLRADLRAPLPASRDHLYRSYDGASLDQRAPLSTWQAAMSGVAATCDTSLF